MVIIYITVYLIIFVVSSIFNCYLSDWLKSKNITDLSNLIVVANIQKIGIIQMWEQFKMKKIPIKIYYSLYCSCFDWILMVLLKKLSMNGLPAF